ncbi:unnamed protein product [Meloidogyne enterolobii]|uniref:Uncharacterized protein n=1 Tax=Meloidogyne enterolobii TaxID=390850 RepID=A0ACB0YLD0_MELEN
MYHTFQFLQDSLEHRLQNTPFVPGQVPSAPTGRPPTERIPPPGRFVPGPTPTPRFPTLLPTTGPIRPEFTTRGLVPGLTPPGGLTTITPPVTPEIPSGPTIPLIPSAPPQPTTAPPKKQIQNRVVGMLLLLVKLLSFLFKAKLK